MKKSMGGGSQKEVMEAMQRAIRELLIFSKNHEALKGRLGTDPYPIMQELIAQYDGLQILLTSSFHSPGHDVYPSQVLSGPLRHQPGLQGSVCKRERYAVLSSA
jgi:hypothetical protein